jgi:uncharacterized protein with von Willebrand factor type A (vWA) domain
MIAGLGRFLTALRGAGIAASPAEWLDALRAVQLLGLDDRRRVRRALRATLVKRASQLETFDHVFDGFFTAPARGGATGDRTGRGAGGTRGRRSGVEPSEEPRKRLSRDEPQRPSASKPDSDPPPKIPRATEMEQRVAELRRGAPHRTGRLRRLVARPEDAARAPRETRRDLARRMDLQDERRLAAEVPRIVERIRLRTGRRLRRAAHGRPYLRRLFRDNMRHGGVPWVIPRRLRRPKRSRVVLLIDVSWSTARAAGLFLSIAGEFLRRVSDARILLFVDRAVDATREVDEWLARHPSAGVEELPAARRQPGAGIVRGGVSFARLVGSLRGLNLDAPSDYGRAFHALTRSRLRPGGSTTVLLVLGDGRTNRFDPLDWSFEELASRCGAVLWLVPEPLERWGSGDSALGAYLPHADVAVEARDLAGLARGVSELVRRL